MGTNSGRAVVSVGRPPSGVFVLVGLSSRRASVNACSYAAYVMLLLVACLRDVVDARPWRACSRVTARFEVSLDYLVVGILRFLWRKLRVVQGFVLIVIPKACARSCGFAKSFKL